MSPSPGLEKNPIIIFPFVWSACSKWILIIFLVKFLNAPKPCSSVSTSPLHYLVPPSSSRVHISELRNHLFVVDIRQCSCYPQNFTLLIPVSSHYVISKHQHHLYFQGFTADLGAFQNSTLLIPESCHDAIAKRQNCLSLQDIGQEHPRGPNWDHKYHEPLQHTVVRLPLWAWVWRIFIRTCRS